MRVVIKIQSFTSTMHNFVLVTGRTRVPPCVDIPIGLIEIDRQRQGELCTVPEAGILGDIDFRAAGRNIKGAYETKKKQKYINKQT